MFKFWSLPLCFLLFALWNAFNYFTNYKQFKYLEEQYSEYQNWLMSGNPDFLKSKDTIKRYFRRANVPDLTVDNNISAYDNFPSTDESLITAHEAMFDKAMCVYREKYALRKARTTGNLKSLGIWVIVSLLLLTFIMFIL